MATGEAPDSGGTESVRTSEVTSDEVETSVVMEGTEGVAAVVAVTDVEEVGEVGEGSFLAYDFFSFARLFWNHTFSSKAMRKEEESQPLFLWDIERSSGVE